MMSSFSSSSSYYLPFTILGLKLASMSLPSWWYLSS